MFLTNHCWCKRFGKSIADDDYFQRSTWKQGWIQQPLEGATTYISKGQIVCSKQVPGFIDYFIYCYHPYYQTKFNDWQKPTHQ